MRTDHRTGSSYGPVPSLRASAPGTDVSIGSPGWYRGTHMANWGYRVAAALIDRLPIYFLADLLGSLGFIVYALYIANSIVMQGLTGQSVGKRLLGLRLATEVVHQPTPGMPPKTASATAVYPGIIRCVVREILHIVDCFGGLGFLRPLWNWRRQTWSDSLCRTVVLAPDAHLALEARCTGQPGWPGG